MEKILIGGKEQYVAIKNRNDNLVYFLTKTGELNTVKDKLFFRNPFDIWDGIAWFGLTLWEIIERLEDSRFLQKFEIHLFNSKEDLIKFLKLNEPEERKNLIKKYKDKNILNVLLGDLKKMGMEIPLC